ncbi:MAG TPA: hypothetical protein VL974_03125 [Magnetospirillum sp.]|jgi:hypothetical protein|nr:hypothetical protein [Magnetospirillum sp.]
MLFGRVMGWLLIGLAVIMASADAVMALGPAEYAGIITADVVTLLTGGEPEVSEGVSLLASIEAMLLDTPAWLVMGPMGTALLVACRKRARRYRFRRD